MKRKITEQLLLWKNNPDRMPLLLNGARQVGKTYSALTFGKEYYKDTAYFNFEDAKDVNAIFERDLDPERIIKELAAKKGQSIKKSDTLIIFDEIQVCERALTALKYFCEQAPGYHIIAAGSLLGVALNREGYSFPVGKVEMLPMFPLDFEEFLWALGEERLSDLISESFAAFEPLALHEKALEKYRSYLVIGGMPAVVADYLNKKDFDFVKVRQKTLNDSYVADMAKYASPQETAKIIAAWSSVPAQLAKENRKFQYKVIKKGARAAEYEMPLAWLNAAGIINKCCLAKEGKLPLAAYANNESFKVYMVDTGLLCSKFDIEANIILYADHKLDGFKGALAENYVMQALVNNGIEPYYWSGDNESEVDFLFQDKLGNVIPVEVKSADNVRARSLQKYIKKYAPPYAIRVSTRNFGFENGIKSIPLYAVWCIKK